MPTDSEKAKEPILVGQKKGTICIQCKWHHEKKTDKVKHYCSFSHGGKTTRMNWVTGREEMVDLVPCSTLNPAGVCPHWTAKDETI